MMMCRLLFLFSLCFLNCNAHEKPHLFTILVDDLGWADIGAWGAEYETPIIDNLVATEGLRLDSYYTMATCTPTRATIMTGRYPYKLGLQDPFTIVPGGTMKLPLEIPTVAELLKKAGYSTHALGKWHLGMASKDYAPLARGFDTFSGHLLGGGGFYNHTVCGGPDNICGYDWREQEDIDFSVNGVYGSDILWDRLENLLDNHDSEKSPFYGYVSYQTIHAPMDPPPRASSLCDHITFEKRRVYCDKIQYLDDGIGKIVSKLKELGMWENSLLVITTDNGGIPHDASEYTTTWISNGCGMNTPLRGGKITVFEGGVRGMGFITGGKLPAELHGQTNNKLFHSIDIPVGQLYAAQARIPDRLDGIDLFDQAFNNGDGHEKVFLSVVDYSTFIVADAQAVRWGEWKYMFGQNYYDGYWDIAEGPPKPAEQDCTEGCLFNIPDDPRETTNLAEEYPEIVEKLRKAIEDEKLKDDYYPQQRNGGDPRAWPTPENGMIWTYFLDDDESADMPSEEKLAMKKAKKKIAKKEAEKQRLMDEGLSKEDAARDAKMSKKDMTMEQKEMSMDKKKGMEFDADRVEEKVAHMEGPAKTST